MDALKDGVGTIGETVEKVGEKILDVPETIIKEIAPESKDLEHLGTGPRGDDNIIKILIGGGAIFALFGLIKSTKPAPYIPNSGGGVPIGPSGGGGGVSPTPSIGPKSCSQKVPSFW